MGSLSSLISPILCWKLALLSEPKFLITGSLAAADFMRAKEQPSEIKLLSSNMVKGFLKRFFHKEGISPGNKVQSIISFRSVTSDRILADAMTRNRLVVPAYGVITKYRSCGSQISSAQEAKTKIIRKSHYMNNCFYFILYRWSSIYFNFRSIQESSTLFITLLDCLTIMNKDLTYLMTI